MPDHPLGPFGPERLETALAHQEIVQHDRKIARQLAASARVVELVAGQQLYAAQEKKDLSVYFILSGRLHLHIGNAGRMIDVGPKQLVGEFPLLDTAWFTYQVTAVAAERTFVAEVPGKAFLDIAEQNPTLWKGLARLIAGRLHARNREADSLAVAPPQVETFTLEQIFNQLWTKVPAKYLWGAAGLLVTLLTGAFSLGGLVLGVR